MRRTSVVATISMVAGGLLAAALPAQAQQAGTPHDSTAIAARYTSQKIDWKPCVFPDVQADSPLLDAVKRMECGSFSAPRDWNAAGDQFDIVVAVSRLRPVSAEPKGSVLTNPGGPGAPGRLLPAIFAGRAKLADSQEIIGIDPRGTGMSTNVGCAGKGEQGAKLDPRDRGQVNLFKIMDANDRIARACQRDSGEFGRFVTTEQTVKDLDLLRVLLGREKINWIGYSGGTWMGAYYATYFPDRVGKFVLDSNVEFTAPFQATFASQPMGFERRFREDFLPWAAANDAAYHLGTTAEDVRRTYEQIRAKLAGKPVVMAGQKVGPTAFDGRIAGNLYSKANFPGLAEARSWVCAP